jgi:RNA polymerase sigma-70 factor (ECF subfamily)
MSHPDRQDRDDLPTTHWTNVRRAGAEAPSGQRVALDELLRRYWPALVAHMVHRKRMPRDRAEDLVQSFIQEKVLERNLVQLADPGKGRFRTFLLTALDRYAIDRWRKESAAPPGAELPPDLGGPEPGPDVDDMAWAMTVLAEGVRRMRAECDAKRRADLWEVFHERALAPLRGCEPVAYKLLAERMGLESDKQAANRFVIALEMFRRNVRAVLAEYAGDDAEAEARDLRQILSGARAELVDRLRNQVWCDVPEITMSPSDESPADAGVLSRLLDSPAPPADAAAQLRQALAAQLPLDLEAGVKGPVPNSLGELLHHPGPPPELLELAKDFAKDNRIDPESPLRREVATVLYYAAIAAALARCGRRITRSDDDTLRRGFQWGCEQSWVDEATRQLLREGLRLLDGR